MPKRISGVSARLLECAKAEFLEKGFRNASIREIAARAETSTRAVYTRFPNKEGLFDAIIMPVMDEFVDIYRRFGECFWKDGTTESGEPLNSENSTEVYNVMMNYIYDHEDEFMLAMKCLEATRFKAMLESLIGLNNDFHNKFLEFKNDKNHDIVIHVIHMLTHSFYNAMFEPLLHGMSREEALYYVKQLCSFYVNGAKGLEF